jgi:WNK lysine deficient protein kinase
LTLLGYYIACHLYIEILKGVNYLHTRKPQILHMDLHLGNILLRKAVKDDKIELKIADFGLAKICELAQKSKSFSTDRSLSHSNHRSTKKLSDELYNENDDIYSLGMILKELFSIDTNRL